MRDNDRCCFILDGRVKNFSWVHQTLIECADTDDMGIDHSTGTVKRDSNEVFSTLMMIGFEIVIGTAGIGNDGIIFDTIVTGAILSDLASTAPVAIAVCRFLSHLMPPEPNEAL